MCHASDPTAPWVASAGTGAGRAARGTSPERGQYPGPVLTRQGKLPPPPGSSPWRMASPTLADRVPWASLSLSLALADISRHITACSREAPPCLGPRARRARAEPHRWSHAAGATPPEPHRRSRARGDWWSVLSRTGLGGGSGHPRGT